MLFKENDTEELKEIVVDDIKKEVIAFANTKGGTIYIGVQDNGEVIGVDNTDTVMLQISNMIRDAVKPDVTMFVNYNVIKEEKGNVIAVEVQRGTDRPYYLAKKGLRPEGVYVRQGSSSVPATDTAIRKMIKDTDGDSFEDRRSLKQNLTFDSAAKEFSLRNIPFGKNQMQTLKILNTDGIYTNLGLLLSDQCIHTVKVAVFQGVDQGIFKDRKEFGGSLLKQLNDIYEYIQLHNHVNSDFKGLLRIDSWSYPVVAIREALLNLLVHRDYSFGASALISIYDDRIEFVSVGGLLNGIALDDIMAGISVCRNPNLANIFYRLKLIEAYGTGIRKILNAYKDMPMKPVIENTSNAFKIILPDMNLKINEKCREDHSDIDFERELLVYLKQHNMITRKDLEEKMGISSSTAVRLIKKLQDDKKIIRQGNGRSTTYLVVR